MAKRKTVSMENQEMPKTVQRGPILRGTVPYVAIKEIGELGDKGKRVMSIGYQGKFIANEDAPLSSLAGALIEELLPFIRWPNADAGKADLAALKEYVASLEINELKAKDPTP